MHLVRNIMLTISLMVLLTACAATPGKEKEKVHCPACGTDFDALFHKRF